MRIIEATIDTFGQRSTAEGVSREAVRLLDFMKESYEHFWEPRLNILVPQIESLGDASEDAEHVADLETVAAAIRFAYCLPRLSPIPAVSVDPDGEISFDWVAPYGREMFSVSVNRRNRLAFAGWFGETSRVHGVEQLAESCPQEIIRGIQKATRAEFRRTN